MIWFVWLLPIIAGALDAGSRVVIKKTKVNLFLLAGFGFLCATPFYAVWVWYQGFPAVITKEFWFAVAGVIPLGVIAGLLTVESHRKGSFNLTVPYLSLTPALLLITSAIMGGGHVTFLAGIGILTTVVGVYILNCSTRSISVFAPFKALVQERSSLYMIFVAFIYSISTNLDFIGKEHASASLYMLINHGSTGLVILFIGALWYRKEEARLSFVEFKKSLPIFLLFGAFIGVQMILHLQSFDWIPNVPYVISVKRVGAVLFTIGAGLFLALWSKKKELYKKEKQDIVFRIGGMLLMLGGMLLVIFFG